MRSGNYKFGRRLNLRLYESHSLIYQSLTFFPEKKVVSASVNVKIQLVCNFVFFTKEFVSWSLLLFLLFDSLLRGLLFMVFKYGL